MEETKQLREEDAGTDLADDITDKLAIAKQKIKNKIDKVLNKGKGKEKQSKVQRQNTPKPPKELMPSN
jgi:hypothetical protein